MRADKTFPEGGYRIFLTQNVSIYWENNDRTLIYPVAALGVVLLGTYKFFSVSRTRKEILGEGSTPDPSHWNKMPSSYNCCFFSLEYMHHK
jgi:hypothetical protein